MALTESIEYDKIEVVGSCKAVQVRKKNTIKKDGVEIASNYERYVLDPGAYNDEFDRLDATDISKEPAEVQAICNAVWTDDVKTAWKTKLKADFDAAVKD